MMMTFHSRILMMMMSGSVVMAIHVYVRQLDLMPESQLAGALQAWR